MRRLALVVVVVLAVLIDGFFALVNFYPVAPARSRGPRRRVLMALDPVQARWLGDNLVDEFNREHNLDLALTIVPESELLDKLRAAPDDQILAVIPRALGRRAAADHLVRSFEEVVPAATLAADFDSVAPEVRRAAQLDGHQLFLPRLALVDIAVFRISRVRDAVRHWTLLRAPIDAALRALNGRGLPPGYQLELDPERWDGYDRFVIGYYWAHRRYGGQPGRGRIAHRTGEQLDGAVDIVEGLYRAGMSDATLARVDGAPARDYFAWEQLYRRHRLYSEDMLGERPLDDDGLIERLRRGDIFLATVDTMQAFTLHGGSHMGSPPGVDDPDDLGFAPLAALPSIELLPDGRPARTGQPFSFREDWVWALPARVSAHDAELAYELVKFLWERDNHYRECAALGTLPLRNDVVRERSSLFRLLWMDDVLDAAFAEWSRAQPVPDIVAGGLGSTYAQIWDRVVRRDEGPLGALLRAPPPPRPPPPPPRLGAPELAHHAPPRSDEDSLDAIDDELWRGQVELDRPRDGAKP